jgi:hypothetical protein
MQRAYLGEDALQRNDVPVSWAKLGRAGILWTHRVFFATSCGGIYAHLHLDFGLACGSLICNMNDSKIPKFPAAI